MKLLKTASGKTQVKISKSDWESIGKKHGWLKEAQHPNFGEGGGVDSDNPNWITQQLRTYLRDPESFWSEMAFSTGKDYMRPLDKEALLKDMLLKLKNVSPTLEMLTKEEQKSIARRIISIKEEVKHDKLMELEEGNSPVATIEPSPQKTEHQTEEGGEMEDLQFATPRQVSEIKDQLLDRYIKKEITEEQLKNMLTEFAKKHNLNIKLSKSNGKLQVRIGKRG